MSRFFYRATAAIHIPFCQANGSKSKTVIEVARIKSNSCLGWIISCRTIYQLQRKKNIVNKVNKKNNIVSHQVNLRYKGPILCNIISEDATLLEFRKKYNDLNICIE